MIEATLSKVKARCARIPKGNLSVHRPEDEGADNIGHRGDKSYICKIVHSIINLV